MKYILALILTFGLSTSAYAATSLALVDNTLITETSTLKALAHSGEKALVVTGTIGDTFVIHEDGLSVKTITLAAATEKYTFSHIAMSYKVDWTLAGAGGATLYYAGD